jgi:aminopeptidase N
VVAARDGLRGELAQSVYDGMLRAYERCSRQEPFRFDAASVARRRLRNVCLTWLLAGSSQARALALHQYHAADNMTDAQGALAALNDDDCAERDTALADFRDRWRSQPLVLDKWLVLQATTRLPGSIETVQALMHDGHFDQRNPNRVRALIGAFAHGNLRGFHRADGAGYALVAGQVRMLDAVNPQVAARLASAFTRWRRLVGHRREMQLSQLEWLQSTPGLSSDVHEIVSKSLALR